MKTVAHGPYEHRGAYAELAESEVFDTSGTEPGFCDYCEHVPCVAGGRRFCSQNPRFITVQALSNETDELRWEFHEPGNPLSRALSTAVLNLGYAAWPRTSDGNDALKALAEIRRQLRAAKEAGA